MGGTMAAGTSHRSKVIRANHVTIIEEANVKTLETNKTLVRDFYERVVNKLDFDFAPRILAERFWDHGNPPDEPKGIEGLRQFLSMLGTAFPDIHVEILDMLSEGDLVAVRIKVTGTHKGILLGKIAATGRHAAWSGMDFLKIQDGKITERWGVRDLLGLMQQLGVVKS